MTDLHLNGWFVFVFLSFFLVWKLDFFITLLNLKAFATRVPPEFSDLIDDEQLEISRDYHRARSVLDIAESIFMLILFFVFWWLGGFGWLDEKVRSLGQGPILSGLIYVSTLYLALQLISLPISWYSTFGIEGKFGFNRTKPSLFFADFMRNILLSAALGLPLLALLLWVFAQIPLAWFWGWLIVVGFMIAGAFLAPTLILPLYNKFNPLEEGELKEQIFGMAAKCEFPVREISVMDGSKRSSKANAFFTGFGSTKRIVLFDTLIENHSVRELVGVLAHEIGHFKKRHILKNMVLGVLSTGLTFFLLGLMINNRSLFDAFAVENTSIYVSLVLFTILLQPVNEILSVAGNCLSRKNEFEADAFASDATGEPEALASALRKLSVDTMSNLTPHPAYVFLNYSHPPVLKRIEALRKT